MSRAFLVVLAVLTSLLFLVAGDAQEENKTIQWLDGKGLELEDKKKQKGTSIFEDIDVLSDKKLTKSIMIYFFYPKIEDEKKAKKDEVKQFKACECMEQKIFSKNEIMEKLEEFICVKVDITNFPKVLKDKYKVRTAPIALFFDCVGRASDKLDDPNKNVRRLLTALSQIVKNSDEEIKKAPVLRALQLINAARKQAGLKEVSLSESFCKGCEAHAKYLVLNRTHPSTQGLDAHKEDPNLPGYTAEGAAAGKSSDISYVSPDAAVPQWLATFYHRIPLLQPELESIGVGYARDESGVISVVDCIQGLQKGRTGPQIVLFPPDGSSDVPLEFGKEIPDPVPKGADKPAGYPITLTFFNYSKYSMIEDVRATLADGKGKAIAFHISDPQHPATDWHQWNTVCLIPSSPLQNGEKYTVTVHAKVDGRPFEKSWSFTTVQAQ